MIIIPEFELSKPPNDLLENWQGSSNHFAVSMLFARSRLHPKDLMLVLAKRTDHLRTHSGQIGMPGGRISPEDKTPVDTAFRETEEELGIPRTDITFHGYLSVTPTLQGGTLLPCAASTTVEIEDFRPSVDEVATLVFAPWQDFRREQADSVKFNYFGVWRNSVHFQIKDHRVWGLTAGILHQANLRSAKIISQSQL